MHRHARNEYLQANTLNSMSKCKPVAYVFVAVQCCKHFLMYTSILLWGSVMFEKSCRMSGSFLCMSTTVSNTISQNQTPTRTRFCFYKAIRLLITTLPNHICRIFVQCSDLSYFPASDSTCFMFGGRFVCQVEVLWFLADLSKSLKGRLCPWFSFVAPSFCHLSCAGIVCLHDCPCHNVLNETATLPSVQTYLPKCVLGVLV